MIERTNYQWLNDLQQNGSTRLQAIADLRERLERGIYHYLCHARTELADRLGNDLNQVAQNLARESIAGVLDNLESYRNESQFTTWAAKFAARVSISRLRDDQGTLVALEQSPSSMRESVRAKLTHARRFERSPLERQIAVWEDEGGRV